MMFLTVLFGLIISKDMDSKNDADEDCFSEQVQAKIAEFNQSEIEEIYDLIEEPHLGNKVDESQHDSEEDNGPDVLLIARISYKKAEKLFAKKSEGKDVCVLAKDIQFYDFYPQQVIRRTRSQSF